MSRSIFLNNTLGEKVQDEKLGVVMTVLRFFVPRYVREHVTPLLHTLGSFRNA